VGCYLQRNGFWIQLKQQLAEMKRLIFGQKRERFIPSVSLNQLFLLGNEQMPAPTLLISEYTDHLPLYHQKKIFKRCGMDIPSSTTNN
jgi:hypothetical protein